jgi:hypothetical protein
MATTSGDKSDYRRCLGGGRRVRSELLVCGAKGGGGGGDGDGSSEHEIEEDDTFTC